MARGKMPPVDVDGVDAMLARWREMAGADWEAIFRKRLGALGRHFEGERDPLDAWEALLFACALGEAPPQWALDYLTISAARILDLRAQSMQGNTVKPAMIGRALGMVADGAGTAFPAPGAYDWIAVALQIRSAIGAGMKEYLAIENVAKVHDISESKAGNAWKRFQATCPELL